MHYCCSPSSSGGAKSPRQFEQRPALGSCPLVLITFLCFHVTLVSGAMYLSPQATIAAPDCANTCNFTNPCLPPKGQLSIGSFCYVYLAPGNYTNQVLNLQAATLSLAPVNHTSSSYVEGLTVKLNASSWTEIWNLSFTNHAFDISTSTQLYVRHVSWNLSSAVQHNLTFAVNSSFFSFYNSNIYMESQPAGRSPITEAALSITGLQQLDIRYSIITLPFAFSLDFVYKAILYSSNFTATSFLPSASIDIQDSNLYHLTEGLFSSNNSMISLAIYNVTIDRRYPGNFTILPARPFLPLGLNINGMSIRLSSIYHCQMDLLIDIITIQQSSLFDSPVSVSPLSSPSPGNWNFGFNATRTIYPSSSLDPPLLTLNGTRNRVKLVLAFSVNFGNPPPSETLVHYCDLLLQEFDLQASRIDVDALCISGNVSIMSSLSVFSRISKVPRESPSPDQLRLSGSMATLDPILYGVNITVDMGTTLWYRATSSGLGIHNSTNSVYFSPPLTTRVIWAYFRAMIPGVRYPLIRNAIMPNETLTVVGYETEFVSASSTLLFFGNLVPVEPPTVFFPSPSIPTTGEAPEPECPPPRPSEDFYCVNGHWQSNTPVSDPTVVIPPNVGPVTINGNLTVTDTLVFSGPGSTLVVSGCASIIEAVRIELTEQELESLLKNQRGTQELVRQGLNCTNDLSALAISVQGDFGCKRVRVTNIGSRSSLTATFSVEEGGCSKNSKILIAIVVPCTIVGVLLIAALIGYLVWRSKKAVKSGHKRFENKSNAN